MGFERLRDPRGAGAVAAAIGLAAAGATMVWAIGHGFYGTTALAALVGLWLTAILWWTVSVPRDATPGATAAVEVEDDRIVLRALLDQAPGALLAVEGSRVRALNRAARALFATDDFLLPPPPALLSADATRLRHGGRSWRIDRAAVQGGDGARTLVALVDVEPAEHAAEARATRDLLRVLGHEVMNAMAPISSLAESALAVMAVPERRDRLLPEILGTLARRTDGLRRFTEAYRQVARLPDPAIAPVPVAALFADVARLFEAQWRDAAMLVVDDPGEAVATLDREQIVQALLAVLRNGVEAMQAAGTPPVVRLAARSAPDRITLSVEDGGAGALLATALRSSCHSSPRRRTATASAWPPPGRSRRAMAATWRCGTDHRRRSICRCRPDPADAATTRRRWRMTSQRAALIRPAGRSVATVPRRWRPARS